MKLPTLLIVAVFALTVLGIWAVIFPGPVFADIVLFVVLVTLVASIVAAFTGTGCTRAFLCGFAAFGNAYFLITIVFGPAWSTGQPEFGAGERLPRTVLITTYALALSYDRLGFPEIWTSGGTKVPPVYLLRMPRAQIPDYLQISEFEDFMKTGQCLMAVVMGLIGGWIGWRLRDGETTNAAPDAQGAGK